MNDDELDLVTSWAEGWLGGASARRAEQLAAGDPELAAHAEWVRGFRARTADVTYSGPDPVVTSAILASFDPDAVRPSLLRRIQALLTLDSRTVGLAGVRSPLNLDSSWDQVFRADSVEVALTCIPEADGVIVIGQVLDPDGGRLESSVQLVSGENVVDATISDGLGEFELTAARDSYELHLTIGERGIEVALPLDLRSSESDR